MKATDEAEKMIRYLVSVNDHLFHRSIFLHFNIYQLITTEPMLIRPVFTFNFRIRKLIRFSLTESAEFSQSTRKQRINPLSSHRIDDQNVDAYF